MLHNLAASYLATKDYAKALEHFAMALGTYGALNQAFGQGMALNNMGGVQLTLGQYEQARKQFILSASFFRSAQEPSWEAQSLENLAAAEAGMGNPKAAMESYSRALELWQKLEQHDRQAMILNRIAGLRIGKGEKRTALELHSRALALAQKSGSATVLASTRISLGRLYFEAKNFSLARTEFQAALLLYEEQRDKRGQAATFLDIARLNFAAGEELAVAPCSYFGRSATRQPKRQHATCCRNRSLKPPCAMRPGKSLREGGNCFAPTPAATAAAAHDGRAVNEINTSQSPQMILLPGWRRQPALHLFPDGTSADWRFQA